MHSVVVPCVIFSFRLLVYHLIRSFVILLFAFSSRRSHVFPFALHCSISLRSAEVLNDNEFDQASKINNALSEKVWAASLLGSQISAQLCLRLLSSSFTWRCDTICFETIMTILCDFWSLVGLRTHCGALDFPAEVEANLPGEFQLGCVAGPFDELPFPNAFVVSPLNTIPKRDKLLI